MLDVAAAAAVEVVAVMVVAVVVVTTTTTTTTELSSFDRHENSRHVTPLSSRHAIQGEAKFCATATRVSSGRGAGGEGKRDRNEP